MLDEVRQENVSSFHSFPFVDESQKGRKKNRIEEKRKLSNKAFFALFISMNVKQLNEINKQKFQLVGFLGFLYWDSTLLFIQSLSCCNNRLSFI